VLALTGIIIGDSKKRTEILYFIGGISFCIFLAHLVMLILMKVAGIF
jgi:peptidoglycan/LPS O-acetylase OafA/YrhL